MKAERKYRKRESVKGNLAVKLKKGRAKVKADVGRTAEVATVVRTVINRNASVARRMRELRKKNHGKERLRPLRVSWLNRRKLFRRVSRTVIRVLKLLAVVKAATRINHAAANELCPIPKPLAPHARDLVQDQSLEAAQEAVRVHVRVHVRGLHLDHDRALDLDPSLDPDPEVFRDQEVARHPGHDQGQPKAGQDRGRVRARVAHDQGLTVAREKVDQSQGQDRVRERVVLGRGRRAVQGKAYHRQGHDPKVARVPARSNASREARVDRGLNRSLSQDLNQDREAVADRDRAPDRRVVLEAEVRADPHVLHPRYLENQYREAAVVTVNKSAALATVIWYIMKKEKRSVGNTYNFYKNHFVKFFQYKFADTMLNYFH